ncbi:uncharacterized protein MCYG_07911 [Microsporum canis CBS 113480]|uniref:Uncharacterized protein n=1 Tax=Arthroderma otae (strain ATCC MYA-4605 / CBS 113480) TaxID=554155 RepID=C5FXQ2_ARTOC|nr:uncharacterized protein MCYG_07911 [Microsporum canis CBS 113480]EEQ35092.1 predicted protein [Microsporum canis CBS 113480]
MLFLCCFPTSQQPMLKEIPVVASDEGFLTRPYMPKTSVTCWDDYFRGNNSMQTEDAPRTSFEDPQYLSAPPSRHTQNSNKPSKLRGLRWIIYPLCEWSYPLPLGADVNITCPNTPGLMESKVTPVVVECFRPYPPGLRKATFTFEALGERQTHSIEKICRDHGLKAAVINWNPSYKCELGKISKLTSL